MTPTLNPDLEMSVSRSLEITRSSQTSWVREEEERNVGKEDVDGTTEKVGASWS